MVFIEVMTADREPSGKFHQIRVPIKEASTLPKNNILFVIVSAPAEPGRKMIDGVNYDRVACGGARKEEQYADRLVLVIRNNEFMLFSVFNYIYSWYSTVTGKRLYKAEHPPIYPPDAIFFEGVQINGPDFDEAKAQFEAEMF